MEWLIYLGLLAIGAIAKGIAGQHTAEASAAKAEAEASALEELSDTGGYYDQVLGALESELADVEADRAAAAQLLSITETELKGEIKQSFIQEKAQIAGFGAQIAGFEAQIAGFEAQKTGQVVTGIETAQAGAEAIGQAKAMAGAGGLAQTGSVLRRSEAIARAIGRRISAVNLGIGATRQAIGATRQAIGATEQSMIATRGAAELQRGRFQNDITRAQLRYQNELRGLQTREAETLAQETMAGFKKSQGLKEAERLRSESEWLKTWGVGLAWASALTGGLTDIFGLGLPSEPGVSMAEGMTGIKSTPYRDMDFGEP